MHSGPPATMTHQQTRQPLPGRGAKRVHAKTHELRPPRFEGREDLVPSLKGLRKTESSAAGFDFPITVMGHSPRIG